MNTATRVVLRYPITELLLSAAVVLVGLVLPWQTVSQRDGIAMFNSLSFVVACMWLLVVWITPPTFRWGHIALGAAWIVVGIAIEVTSENPILSILFISLGSGIAIAGVSCIIRQYRGLSALGSIRKERGH